MFCFDCEKQEVEIGSAIKVKGLIGTLTKILDNRILITVADIAYVELAYDNERWYNTADACQSPRMNILSMSDYTMEDGKLYFKNTDFILNGNEVQIRVDDKKIWVRVITQTAVTMHWCNNGSDVKRITIATTQEDPCVILVDDLGRSYYAVYVEDGDYQATQLYTNRDGKFVRLEHDLSWRFDY